jgi:hypothetical protein
MVFKEIFAVYSENNMKQLSTFHRKNAELFIVKACGAYSYH